MVNFLLGFATGAILMIVCIVFVIFRTNEEDEENILKNR